jgi:hypothetical protein
MSQFLSVPGDWVYCDPTEEQKSYAIPRGFVCQTALILPRAMKQLPVPRDRKKVAEKETVAPTRRRHTGGRAGVAAGERRKR